jgi:hypothetical protein
MSLTASAGCSYAQPVGVHATLTLAPGCSPWRLRPEPTTSKAAITDGGQGDDMPCGYPPDLLAALPVARLVALNRFEYYARDCENIGRLCGFFGETNANFLATILVIFR